MSVVDRQALSDRIAQRLNDARLQLRNQWVDQSRSYFLIDNLLDPLLAEEIFRRFPDSSDMHVRNTLREHKYVAAQMDRFDPLLEEVVFAFQQPTVREAVSRIVDLDSLLPDERLYAGGISMMAKDHFLNPHLDNSHDNDRKTYRVLNLLYYVSPGWNQASGGSLELWPHGTRAAPTVIESRFNRLVVMATNPTSWHSVSRIRASQRRCCVSNYFFSERSPTGNPYFHVTSFRGRPEEPVRDLLLRGDVMLRSALRKVFPTGFRPTWHIYRK